MSLFCWIHQKYDLWGCLDFWGILCSHKAIYLDPSETIFFGGFKALSEATKGKTSQKQRSCVL